MPGTVYSSQGPLDDPTGRAADFARFVEAEASDLLERLIEAGDPREPYLTAPLLRAVRARASELAERLEGFTTADD